MIPYIINVSLVLTGCLAFYKLLLQKETFYRVNRYLLLVCLIIAFTLPLLPVPQQLSFRKADNTVVLHQNISSTSNEENEITSISTEDEPLASQQTPNGTGNKFSFQQIIHWVTWIYWFGVIIFSLNFMIQIIMLFYRAYTNPVIKEGRFRIVEVSGDKAPCSFANNIFINPEKYDWETYKQILQHEKIHISQKHSIDILVTELVLIMQWFNPFAWLYRKEVENNLEFLTDDQLVQKEKVEKKGYQLNLLKVSAPHFPLSLTTNYNQSLLKKRIAMMNSKRSSVHTVWKYFFLLPLLLIFASLLNEPLVRAQSNTTVNKTNETNDAHDIKTEGYWFATINGQKVNMRFTQDENDHNSYNGSEFSLTDFPNLPRGTNGDFKLTREPGTMNFNGKFDGNQGMGRYKFIADKEFGNYMSGKVKEKLDDEDLMVFFFININKSYVQMLNTEGYNNIDKDDLIAMSALKVDKAFITSIKENGYKDVDLDQYVSLKALGVDGAYIKEIKDAGYRDISLDELVSFKAQGINKDYLAKLPKSKTAGGTMSADDVVSLKALNIDEGYAEGFKSLGYRDIEPDDLISMKAMGITPEFVKQFQDIGYKNIPADDLVSMKAQNVTPEFVKELEQQGYKNVEVEDIISVKALGVKPEYIGSFKSIGYSDVSLEDAVAMKSQGITPEFIKSFEALGYKNIPLDDIVALKAVGVTPEWIKDMKSKGFNYDKLEKYISLKAIQ